MFMEENRENVFLENTPEQNSKKIKFNLDFSSNYNFGLGAGIYAFQLELKVKYFFPQLLSLKRK